MARRKAEPPTEAPPPEACRQTIEDLLAVYEAPQRVSVGQAKGRHLESLHGLIAYTVAQVRASLVLIDAGHAFPAQANARVAYEYALAIQWIHLTDEGLEKFAKHGHRRAKILLDSAERAGLSIPQDIAAALEEGDDYGPSEPQLKYFEQLCRRFDPTGWLYVVYRQLSSYIHPSSAVAVSYLDRSTRPVGLVRQAQPEPRPLLWTLAFATALAVGVHEDMVRFKPNKAKVRDIATRAGLLTLLDPDPAPASPSP